MRQIVNEWVDKAEADFRTAHRELPIKEDPNYDLVCFLVQQSVEKYLKALLSNHQIEFEKTHNLLFLLEKLIGILPLWEAWVPSMKTIKQYYVQFRYPGASAEYEDAARAFDIAKGFREAARKELGL